MLALCNSMFSCMCIGVGIWAYAHMTMQHSWVVGNDNGIKACRMGHGSIVDIHSLQAKKTAGGKATIFMNACEAANKNKVAMCS